MRSVRTAAVRLLPLIVLLAALGAQADAPSTVTERPKLLVTQLSAQGVASEQASAFTEAVVSALSSRNLFQVIAAKDVQTLQSAARVRQLSGACANQGEGCAVDLGDAIGARFVLTGSLSRYADTYELSLEMVDTQKSRRVSQSSRLSHDLETLRLLVPYAAAEVSGSPLPPPASRWKQYTGIASGAALVVAGGFLGMYAVAQEKNLNDELASGKSLRPLSFYSQQDTVIGHQKSIGLAMMVGGAALAAAGLYFMPPPEGGPRVALVPQLHGMAIVGVFP